MAIVAGIPLVVDIVKGIVDVGIGLYSLYKSMDTRLEDSVDAVGRGVSRLEDSVDAVGRDVSRLEVGVSRVGQGVDQLRSDMKAVRQEIQKVLDNQASLVALFAQGADEICARLDALQLQVDKGFNAVLKTVKDDAALRDAREFKMRLGAVTMAYDLITQDITEAAKSKNKRLPSCTSRDADKAEASANDLYLWASAFVPDNPQSAQGATRQDKLQTMPYIVAMAYAVRVKVIVQFLERDMAAEEQEKTMYVDRARMIVDEFIAVLTMVLEGLMANTSLLEIALVYQLPMATYLTLMTTFGASVDELLAPSAKGGDIAVWDDGLAPIRQVLQWNVADADDPLAHTIALDSIAEGVWWATFTGADLKTTSMSKLRTSIYIREICHILGAGGDERLDRIALKPGQNSALLQLPPATALRAALCANITQACDAAAPQSFARINKPLPPGQIMRSAVFSPARIQVAADPRTLTGHTSAVYGVAVCPDGERVVSGSYDKTARVWSLSTGQHLRTFAGHSHFVSCVAVTPDGKAAVSGSWDESVCVWSVDSGRAHHTLQGHFSRVFSVAVSPDGRSIASGSIESDSNDDKTIKLWNVDSGQCQATLTGGSDCVNCVEFSPDGETLVSGSDDNSIKVWNVRTGALRRTLNGHSYSVFGVAVTPDGQWLVSGSGDKTVKVWRLSSGAEEMAFTEHTDWVSCVAVFPDGLRIASGSHDKTVRVWNLRSRKLELTLTGHSNGVKCVAVSPDGRSVVSGSGDNTIKVWALSDGG